MTEATVRRNIAKSADVLVHKFGMPRADHKRLILAELLRLARYTADAHTYGLTDALESAERVLRDELTWRNEMSELRASTFTPKKLTGFAAECALAAAMR